MALRQFSVCKLGQWFRVCETNIDTKEIIKTVTENKHRDINRARQELVELNLRALPD